MQYETETHYISSVYYTVPSRALPVNNFVCSRANTKEICVVWSLGGLQPVRLEWHYQKIPTGITCKIQWQRDIHAPYTTPMCHTQEKMIDLTIKTYNPITYPTQCSFESCGPIRIVLTKYLWKTTRKSWCSAIYSYTFFKIVLTVNLAKCINAIWNRNSLQILCL